MPFCGKIGDVAIPVQQIKRGVIFTQQIIFDDRRPNQVLAAQHVERQRKEATIQIAMRCAQRFDHRDLIVVDEIQQFATRAEIDLRGKECRAAHLVGTAGCGEDGKRRG